VKPIPDKAKPWLRLAVGGATALAIACSFTPPHEGTRYTAYPDPGTRGAPWTICDGHTKGVRQHDTATPAQCDAWLHEDMASAAAVVHRCIHVPLNVNQSAALYDTVFNVGPAPVCGSTLQRLANAGDLRGMCAQLPRWKYANKVIYRGLIGRRADAMELCNWPTKESP
jgi:lysozyme